MTQIKYQNYTADNVSFSSVKVVPMGGGKNRKLVYLNYGGENRPFILQTPELRIPFNLNVDQETDDSGTSTGREKYSFILSFGDTKSDEKLQKFYEVFESINELVKEECRKNSLAWLKKKKVNKTEIDVLYNDHIKRYRDKETGECTGKYPDTFKVKLPYYDGKFACSVFDKDRKAVEDIRESFKSKATGKFLIQCNGVYFASGKFGISWKLVQAKIDVPASFDECMISDDEDVEDLNREMSVNDEEGEEEEVEEMDAEEEVEDEEDDMVDNTVDSSSEEEEEAPPPPPPKKKKKKKSSK